MLAALPFLVVVGAALPVLAWVERRRQLATLDGERTAELSPRAIAIQVILLQGVVAALAWLALRAVESRVAWALEPSLTAAGVGLGVLAGGVLFAWLERRRPLGPNDELRRQLRQIPPTDPYYVATAVAAAFGEEFAYRGALTTVLAAFTPTWIAIAGSALLFGLAHLGQGWRGVVGSSIFGLALQAVVGASGGLALAIGVHFVYDIVAAWMGWSLARRAQSAAAG